MKDEQKTFFRDASAALYLQGILIAKLGMDPDTATAKQVEAEIVARLTAGPDKVLRCAFCGEPYPEGTPTHKHEALAAHIRVCTKHPVGLENQQLREQVAQIEKNAVYVVWALDEATRISYLECARLMALRWESLGPVGNGRLSRYRFWGDPNKLFEFAQRVAPPSEAQQLLDYCRAYIAKQEIHSAETINQCDHVITSAYEFIEGVCKIAGYHRDPTP